MHPRIPDTISYTDNPYRFQKVELEDPSYIKKIKNTTRVDLALSNAEIDGSELTYDFYKLAKCSSLSAFQIESGGLKIPIRQLSTPYPETIKIEFMNSDKKYLTDATYNGVYQFIMHINFDKSRIGDANFNEFVYYEPELPVLELLGCNDFDPLRLRIIADSNHIQFLPAVIHPTLLSATPIKTFYSQDHNLTTGDRIYDSQQFYFVTAIDQDTFSVDYPNRNNYSFLIPALDFNYNIKLHVYKRYEVDINS